MKKGDGMFMRVFHEVAKQYPMIESQDMIVDNTCMQMVSNPHQFDVMVRRSHFNPMLSAFEILNNATIIIQNWLVSRFFASIFQYLNFTEKHEWQFALFYAEFVFANFSEIICNYDS